MRFKSSILGLVYKNECIRELECPAKMFGEHVRRLFPCSAGLSVTFFFLLVFYAISVLALYPSPLF